MAAWRAGSQRLVAFPGSSSQPVPIAMPGPQCLTFLQRLLQDSFL